MQGVGFRWFVRRAADELQLGGWVRNLADGSVEVLAVGLVSDVARLRERLAAGPAHARVERLVDLQGGVEPEPSSFEIRADESR